MDASAWLHSAPRPAAAACWTRLLPEQLCRAAESETRKLTRCSGGGCTHWVDATASPRCALEMLAIHVVEFHLQRLGFLQGRRAGAEWWVQRREICDSLSVHWDCDETRKSGTGEHIPPFLATVNYLTNEGAPTIVLPIAADARGRGVTMPSSDEEDSARAPTLAAYASFPLRGKHLAFDGRLLHGAVYDGPDDGPEDLDEGATTAVANSPAAAERLTVLVNLWIDHQPDGVVSLSDELLEAVTAAAELDGTVLPVTFDVPPSASAHAVPPHCRAARTDGVWREFPIGSFHHPPVRVLGVGEEGFARPEMPIHFVEMVGVEVDPGTAVVS